MTSFIIYYEGIWLKCESAENILVEALHIEFQNNLSMVHGKRAKTEQHCLCCKKMRLIMGISQQFY
jgi:hypothetical protein